MLPDFWNMMSGQKGEDQNFLSRFGGAIKGQEPLQHMYQRIGNELGIPGLQSTADQVNRTNANIPTTYTGASRGFDVNANQLDRTIGTKQSEYAPVVGNANAALGSARNTASTQFGQEQTQQQKELLPYQSEQSLMMDRHARESSGYTTLAGQELQSYIAKAQSGVQLTDSELSRANQLAIQKMNYDATIRGQDLQNSQWNKDYALKLADQFNT